MGRIRISIPGLKRGFPYLVCKNNDSFVAFYNGTNLLSWRYAHSCDCIICSDLCQNYKESIDAVKDHRAPNVSILVLLFTKKKKQKKNASVAHLDAHLTGDPDGSATFFRGD